MDATEEESHGGEHLPATAEEIRRKRLEYFSLNQSSNLQTSQTESKAEQNAETHFKINEMSEPRYMNGNANHQNSGNEIFGQDACLRFPNDRNLQHSKTKNIMGEKVKQSSISNGERNASLVMRNTKREGGILLSSVPVEPTQFISTDSYNLGIKFHNSKDVHEELKLSPRTSGLGSKRNHPEDNKMNMQASSLNLFSPRMQENIKAALGEKGLQDLLIKVSKDIEKLHQEQQSGKKKIDEESVVSDMSFSSNDEQKVSSLSKSSTNNTNVVTRNLQQLKEGENDMFKKFRNYEQVTIPKNTINSFSTDEIYRQAYNKQTEPETSDKAITSFTSQHPGPQPNYKADHPDYHQSVEQRYITPRRKFSYDGSANLISYAHHQNPYAFPPPPLYPGPYDLHGVPVSPRTSAAPTTHFGLQDRSFSAYHQPSAAPQHFDPTFAQYLAYTNSTTPPSPSSFYYPSPHILNSFGVPTFPNGVPLHLPPPPLAAHHKYNSSQPLAPHPPSTSARRNSIPNMPTANHKMTEPPDEISVLSKVPHPPYIPPPLSQRDTLYQGPEKRRIIGGNSAQDLRTSDYKLQKYFESLQLEESGSKSLTPYVELESDRNGNEDASSFATSAAAKGMTGRLQNLGVDPDHLKYIKNGSPAHECSTAGEDFETLSKGVRLCPECGTSNKAYMNWCLSCGEVLIGIEPCLPSDNKKAKRREKMRNNKMIQSKDFSSTVESNSKMKSAGDKGCKDSYPHKDSPESGRGMSLSNSPIRHRAEEHEGPKDSGRASSGELHASDDSVGGTEEGHHATDHRPNRDLNNVAPSENVLPEHVFDHIDDPVVKEFVMAYSKRQSKVSDQSSGRGGYPHSSNVARMKTTKAQDRATIRADPPVQPQLERGAYPLADISADKGELPRRQRLKKSGKKKKKHRDKAIDVEIFGYEEIRDSRNSIQSPNVPLVPALNLVLSSEDEGSNSESSSESGQQSDTDENPLEDEVASLADFEADALAKDSVQPLRSKNPTGSSKTSSHFSKDFAASPPISHGKKGNREQSYITEPPKYQRHWARSSIAWSSYHPRELATRSSIHLSSKSNLAKQGTSANKSQSAFSLSETDRRRSQENKVLLGRPNVPSRQQRPASAEYNSRISAAEPIQRPASAKLATRMVSGFVMPSPGSPPRKGFLTTGSGGVGGGRLSADPVQLRSESSLHSTSPAEIFSQSNDGDCRNPQSSKEEDESPRLLCAELHRLPQEEIEEIHPADKLHAVAMNAYNKFQEMTPRIAEGEVSMWQCLPDEIWIFVFAFLAQRDLKNLMLTCQYFYRLANDETLWRYITVKPRCALTDVSLSTIAHHRPLSVAMVKCQGNEVTLTGLHNFLKECQGRLRELNICGCSQGSFVGSVFLNVASLYCQQLTHLDASYCNITDESLIAISECAEKLESVCVNGFQSMSDSALVTLLKKHGKSLRTLELYACFSLTSSVFRSIGEHCINLRRLCLGSCNKLTDSAMITFSTHLARVEELDLRGCKNIRNDCIRKIVKNCPRIHTLVLANCQQISDVALCEIATYLKDTLRVLDVCGCNRVSDQGVISLSKNCDRLTSVDISSTRCTSTSVNHLASNNCNMYLETVKLSFLPGLSEGCVIYLIRQCQRLKLLHIFGCTSLRNVARLCDLNRKLCIEGKVNSNCINSRRCKIVRSCARTKEARDLKKSLKKKTNNNNKKKKHNFPIFQSKFF
ncbi:hypothetical protein Btru_074892 [Bulinus truncatus]|nr:hypothetical protein Btru_074892 [Bulinus truncatus]